MPPDPASTKDILEQGRSGNPQALADLVERCQTRVHRIVQRRMGPGLRKISDSGDVAQDALIQICKAFPASYPEDQAQFWKWLNGVVENRLRNLARSGKRVPPVIPNQLQQDAAAESDEVNLDQTFEQRLLATGLEELTEKHLQVIRLRDFQGMSFVQVGNQMGLNAEAAWALHKRAMISLIKVIRQHRQQP